ncbi:MAG: TonB-dependent receptor [Marinagarivorans sp.]|nr:TonB-dependent receptor [Marinagarivorans sp.]
MIFRFIPFILTPSILVLPLTATAIEKLGVTVIDAENEAMYTRKNSELKKIAITEQEVERYGDATVGDVLRRLPGMSFTGPAGVTKDVRVRGLAKGYTQFLINGEPAPSIAQDRQMQVDRLPADMIERIEIIHNPSAEYDAGGIGGTINIVLKSKVEDLTRLRVAAGRNGDLDVGDVIGQWSHSFDSVDVLLSLSHTLGAEDILERRATYNGATGALNSSEHKTRPVEKTETLFAPQIIWRINDTSQLVLEPFVSQGAEEKNETSTATNATGAATKKANAFEDKDDKILRFASRYESKTDWGKWHIKGGTQEGSQDKTKTTTERTATDLVNKRAQDAEALEETMNYAGAGINLKLKQHNIKFGVEYRDSSYNKEKTVSEAKNASDPLAPKAPGANDIYSVDEGKSIVYLQDEWHLAEKHWLTGGLRYEGIERDAADRTGSISSSDDSSTNPSLHYRWAFADDINVRASVAQTLRMPKFDLMNPLVTTATGPNPGSITNPDKAGNATLRPEEALGLEFTVEKYFNNNTGLLSYTLYDREVSDYIEKTARLEDGRYVERPYNVGDAEFWGTEVEYRQQLLGESKHSLNLNISHSELHGRVSNSKTGIEGEVKDMPPRISNIGLDWTYLPTRLSAGFSVNYTPEFTRTGANDDGVVDTKTRNSATLLDIYVSTALGSYAELRLIAKNVLSIDKDETTAKYKADGSVNTLEDKIEESEPTISLIFDARF